MYGLTFAAPAAEPVTLAELKKHLNVDHSDDDDLIAALGAAAREATEAEARRVWVSRAVTLTLPAWPIECVPGVGQAVRLPVSPVSALVGVTYHATDGTATALADCQAWLSHSPPLVMPPVGGVWPGLMSGKVAPVSVAFTAGYGAAADVPAAAKAAIKICAADWYENRGDNAPPHKLGMPEAAARLCRLLRGGDYP